MSGGSGGGCGRQFIWGISDDEPLLYAGLRDQERRGSHPRSVGRTGRVPTVAAPRCGVRRKCGSLLCEEAAPRSGVRRGWHRPAWWTTRRWANLTKSCGGRIPAAGKEPGAMTTLCSALGAPDQIALRGKSRALGRRALPGRARSDSFAGKEPGRWADVL